MNASRADHGGEYCTRFFFFFAYPMIIRGKKLSVFLALSDDHSV